jgi:dTDP-4-dehydrorhamnose 3,5-epimerase
MAIELTAENRRMLYIPEGLAHGFQTLEDNTEVFYQMSAFYYPECARGVRWDDEAFQIEWPAGKRIISTKDWQYPNFDL